MDKQEGKNMEFVLTELKRVAQGGEADLYELDGERLLRVLRRQGEDNGKRRTSSSSN